MEKQNEQFTKLPKMQFRIYLREWTATSSSLKIGTKVKNIRLVDGDHNIDCKIDGFGAMKLKS